MVEWCAVEERDVSMVALGTADELFLTSTTRDVQALEALDERTFAAHPVTDEIAAQWREREPVDSDP